jgi:hypothetical protein
MASLWTVETLEQPETPLSDWAVTGGRRVAFSWLKDWTSRYLSACPSACDCLLASACASAPDRPPGSGCTSASQCPSAVERRLASASAAMSARDSAWAWVWQSAALSSSESAAVE